MSAGNGNDARIVNKRLRLMSLSSFRVTVTELQNGLRNRNLTYRLFSWVAGALRARGINSIIPVMNDWTF
jgi:hypothetical protein